MKFWAIAYKYQEDVFYNCETGEDTMDFSSEILLPCETLAQQVINDELNVDYAPVEIEIESVSKQGVICWCRGEFGEWDNNF